MPYLGNKPVNNFVSFAKQDITGNGGTSYSLDYPVTGANDIELFINNVRQEPTEAYSCSGSTLTLTGAITSTDDVYVIFRGRALQTSVHPSDSALEASQATISGKAEVQERIKVGKANIVQTYESYGYIADFQASSGNQTYISIGAPTDSSLGDNGLLIGVDTTAYRITGREDKYMRLATNDLDRLVLDPDGRVTMPYQPMFFGRGRTGTATAVGSYTPVLFSVSQNTGGHWNNSTGTFTAPISGNYLVLWTVGNQGSANNGAYVGLHMLLNNTDFLSGWSLNTGYDSTAHCGGIIPLAAGDTIKFTYHNSYGAPPNDYRFTHATCYLIG